ncbi:MAG: histidine kinase, partial [Treponema sp.]|nr:histidine kinase [Treponema sp.]
IDTMKDVNEENLALYAINVHGAKSSCRGICAEETGLQAETLEKAAKAGNLDFVKANNPLLIENILKLISNIETVINKGSEKTQKTKREKPYTEALKQLRAACRDYKIEDVDNIMKEIEVFEYTSDDGLVRWLRENTDQLNYMEITEKLLEVFDNA